MLIPSATYRIQFNKEFTFKQALKIIPYLNSLGISTLYASPIFYAKPGSMHGYDVVEPNYLNPELGTQEDFDNLISKVKQFNMTWLQDIVPNHMSYSRYNQMLIDLLENGAESRYFEFFDIEWNHPHKSVSDRLLAPFLGKFYKDALESGELKLLFNEDGFSISYFENVLPLKMESYIDLLSYRLGQLRNKIGRNNPDTIKYLGTLYVLKSLSSFEDIDERYYQIKFIKGMIWELYSTNQEVKMSIDETIKAYNGEPGNPESYNMLDKILRDQNYRLAYWKVANEEINYRRFFNISELISLRMELEQVFNRTHSFIIKLIKDEIFNGLRVDHVDGLYDPKQYLDRLKERTKNTYVIVEKILELSEHIPENWNLEGTTGYEFMNYLNGLFINRDNEIKINDGYTSFTRQEVPLDVLMFSKKRLIITSTMAGDVERLAFMIEEVSSNDRFGIDMTMHGLKRALEEVLTYFPVYRTYITEQDYSEHDQHFLTEVFNKVREESPRYENEYRYIEKLLTKQYDLFDEQQKKKAINFVMKFQQLTGPLMAKGFEDTTLYVYNRFLSQNEVGGNPAAFGISDEEFHAFSRERSKLWRHTLNSTSTHDTKRGEDVRARINVLSEIPDEWNEKLIKWNELNKKYKSSYGRTLVPDRNDETFLYQTLLGAFPFGDAEHKTFIKRVQEYVIKATREAKVYTAWINPGKRFEDMYTKFVESILSQDNKEFLNDFREFQNKVAFYGMFNALSQVLVKITSPGVPDFYQGTELWDFSLVDPDNRRPIDYVKRSSMIEKIKNISEDNIDSEIKRLFAEYGTGEIKLFTVLRALELRNSNKELFSEGEYIPLAIEGKFTRNLFGFIRKLEDKSIIILVPRLLTEITKIHNIPSGKDFWKDTSIKPGINIKSWKNCFTGEIISGNKSLSVQEIFNKYPFALLEN